MLGVCQRVAAIPMKRAAPAETRFLERDEIEDLFAHLPRDGRLALRDRALLLFLYNTGARAQEVADLRVGQPRPRRAPPSSASTAKATSGGPARCGTRPHELLAELLDSSNAPPTADSAGVLLRHRRSRSPASASTRSCDATPAHLDDARTDRTVSPHTFRHTAAVHLLEAGVEVNVIRGWLGHADLTTTNRYAEINTKAKIEALRNTEPPGASAGPRPRPSLAVRRVPAQLARIALIVMCR